MIKLSTTRAAKKLGISPIALSRYIAKGKVPAPEIVKLGQSSIHLWTEEEIENVRKLLPKIANGRKTRHNKQSEKAKAESPTRNERIGDFHSYLMQANHFKRHRPLQRYLRFSFSNPHET